MGPKRSTGYFESLSDFTETTWVETAVNTIDFGFATASAGQSRSLYPAAELGFSQLMDCERVFVDRLLKQKVTIITRTQDYENIQGKTKQPKYFLAELMACE